MHALRRGTDKLLLSRSNILGSCGIERTRGSSKFLVKRHYRRHPSTAGTKSERKRSFRWKEKRKAPKEAVVSEATAGTTATRAEPGASRISQLVQQRSFRLIPYYDRSTGQRYTRDHAMAIARRFPLWLASIFVLLYWEETAPYRILAIEGPSMIPTMAPDRSDIWVVGRWANTVWWKATVQAVLGWTPSSYYKVGDLVGFVLTTPQNGSDDASPQIASCKRIVGMPGDVVNRYGSYVHLYLDQDKENWGIMWPEEGDPQHRYVDRSCPWDPVNHCRRTRQEESQRTLIVPEGHVWVEGDCPALALDSRQLGPIPVECLQGKVVARLWPLRRKDNADHHRSFTKRPHPIPLDDETLAHYNVHFHSSSSSS